MPSSSSTPTARPWLLIATRATGASVRIVGAGGLGRARPSPCETPPMPPFTQPQAPKCPSISPIQWCIRT